MPSPVVMAAALSRRTKNAKIAILGNAFCLREHPLTLAEEHAMIDCITGGRLISGMVRGIGAEYYSMGVNPTISHARFQEAHDLVVRGLDQAGPVRIRGQVLPLRIRQRVAAALPAAASADLGAVHRLDRDDRMGGASVAQVRLPAGLQPDRVGGALSQLLPRVRAAHVRLHRKLRPDRLVDAGVCLPTPTHKAREEAKPHIEVLFNRLLRLPFEMIFPPGYLSTKSLKNMRSHKRSVSGQEHTVDC